MKGLFIGLGSVGQRHLRNVRTILGEDAELSAWRSTRSSLLIENGEARSVGDLGKELGVRQFFSLDAALGEAPDFVVICSPTSLHAEALAKCLDAGVYCFVEKPLLANLEQIDANRIPIEMARSRVMVGYQFRFHPAYIRVKEMLGVGSLGRVESAKFEWGTYLPDHHPYEDYRDGYAARLDLGGGVINGLSHDIDLMLDLLGPLEVLSASEPLEGHLEMDGAEESVEVSLRGEAGEQVELCLSYAQREESHIFNVKGELGEIRCDLGASVVSYRIDDESVWTNESLEDCRNQLFINEMRSFLNFVEGSSETTCSFDEGVECIRIADAIRSSIDAG